MSLINSSFFVGELNIVSSGNALTLQRINNFIAKYEKECLLRILGYPLYKILLSETNGLIDRHIIGGLLRNDEQIKVGTTVGIVAGATSFTFDGTGGKPDYRGYQIVPSELNGRGIMIRGVDYSWDNITGVFTLLLAGDIFATEQWYNIHFEPESFVLTDDGTVSSSTQRMLDLLYGKEYTNCNGRLDYWQGIIHDTNISLIANYIYFMFEQDRATYSTGVNTTLNKTEAGDNISPAQKMEEAWNYLSRETMDLIRFLWCYKINDVRVFPEFILEDLWRCQKEFRTIHSPF